jgi:hypothetical protein
LTIWLHIYHEATSQPAANVARLCCRKVRRATSAEENRPDQPDLGPAIRRRKDRLSLGEKETALRVLKKMKAPGRDGIPIELYQTNPFCRQKLFGLIDKMWEYELASPEMLQGVLVCIYKNKGSSEDLKRSTASSASYHTRPRSCIPACCWILVYK